MERVRVVKQEAACWAEAAELLRRLEAEQCAGVREITEHAARVILLDLLLYFIILHSKRLVICATGCYDSSH